MNKIILLGRLTREPEIKYSQGENPVAVARYSLAVNRIQRKGKEPEADYINCVVFGRAAEFAHKYFNQGTKLVISGRLQTGSYTNKEGIKVYTAEVIIEDQEFAESKKANDELRAGSRERGSNGSVNNDDGVNNNGGVNNDGRINNSGSRTATYAEDYESYQGFDDDLPFS